jgi:HSP20 family protein
MDIKKWVPWNWFKKEEESAGANLPVRRSRVQAPTERGYHPVAYLQQELDRVFNDFFEGWPSLGSGGAMLPGLTEGMLKPTLDLSANDKEYIISVEIPGVDEKDVSVELTGDTLAIRGQKKQEKEEKERNFYRMERSYGSFQRVLSLPEDIDEEGIKAKFKKGVLTVTMPRKSVPASGAKRIEVKVAA